MSGRRRARTAPAARPPRAAGVLLHPTSLPGPHPIGDLGPAAHAFLDWLVDAGLSCWQVLPLGPTGYGDSPYTSLSTFAGNPLLVSPELLKKDGLLSVEGTGADSRAAQGASYGAGQGATDFAAARALKERLHREAWDRFRAQPPVGLTLQWESFRDGDWAAAFGAGASRAASGAGSWLADWALFAALKGRFEGRPWSAWDEGLRRRRSSELAAARRELAAEIELRCFEQFLFFRQWTALRAAAAARGIRLIGDLPIYVAFDSADVWANRRLFELTHGGALRAVAGVPPDYFSASGQRWGNPLYRWDVLAGRGYDWWIARVGHQLRLVDLLRLDHFRGFVAYWAVPFAAATAADGRWLPGPGQALFAALRRALGSLPLVAEDLGQIDEPVHALRRRLGLPGMRVLQFAFDEPDSLHAPHRHTHDNAVYTGTHDNDTCRGWLAAAAEEPRRRALTYLGTSAADFAWAMVRAALTSVADLAIVPIQDLLGLGSEARMNTPGRESGNWTFRVRLDQVPADLPGRLRDLAAAAARALPAPPPA